MESCYFDSRAAFDSPDIISLRELTLQAQVGPDRERSQPVRVSLSVYTDLSRNGLSGFSIYHRLERAVSSLTAKSSFGNLVEFANRLAESCLTQTGVKETVKIVVELPKATPTAGVGIEAYRQRYVNRGEEDEEEEEEEMKGNEVGTIPGFNDMLFIKDFIIHVGKLEETSHQTGHVDLRFWGIDKELASDYENIVRTITEHLTCSNFPTIGALANTICRISCIDYGTYKATARVEIPGVLAHTGGAAVEITRSRKQFTGSDTPPGVV